MTTEKNTNGPTSSLSRTINGFPVRSSGSKGPTIATVQF